MHSARGFAPAMAGAVMMLALCGMAPRPPAQNPVLLVLPAQPQLLQVAFDVAALRPAVALLAYRAVEGDDLPALVYAWELGDWVQIGLEDLTDRAAAGPPGMRIMLAGLPTAPASLLAALNAARADAEVEQLALASAADLLNSLHAVCRFSPHEWRRLAQRHDIQLIDHHAPLRAYDPYVLRRSELPLETEVFPVDEYGMPPASLDFQTAPGK